MEANRITRCKNVLVCVVVLALVGCSGSPDAKQTASSTPSSLSIVSNRFAAVVNREGDVLNVSLDTDLPDYAEVMVTVQRSDFEKGSDEEYVKSYFDGKGTVGEWRKPHPIPIGHEIFRAKMVEQQKMTAKAGIGAPVERYSPDVSTSFTLHLFQPNPAFGARNANLTGTATSASGNGRIARTEVNTPYPLDSKATANVPEYGNPAGLEKGKRYQVSRATPLMPVLDVVSDPIPPGATRKTIPVGGEIVIRDVTTQSGTRWYHAEVFVAGSPIGIGWINSIALIGQELRVSR